MIFGRRLAQQFLINGCHNSCQRVRRGFGLRFTTCTGLFGFVNLVYLQVVTNDNSALVVLSNFREQLLVRRAAARP